MLEIVPYNARWPEEFRQIAARLRHALGASAIRIDHIGSTAILDMPAKDVIDIQVTVAALDERVRAAMSSIGYVQLEGRTDHRPPNSSAPDSEWAKWLFLPPPALRRAHVHLRIQGAANQRYAILFRDFLRANAATAKSYAQLKRLLAEHLANTDDYPEVKDPAVDLIYLAAEAWAATTAWQPGPSDG